MNIPEEFISEINSYNNNMFEGLVDSLTHTAPTTSVRANTLKHIYPPIAVPSIPWCEHGWYLQQREAFTFDPAMHQGLYYVQDASSMILYQIIHRLTADINEPLMFLDACAAPGGKTTAAIDALPIGSLVVANEYVPNRAVVLRENIIKWGYPNCIVAKGDTARIGKLSGLFDIIATDVPCSGEGMFRKEPDAVSQWSATLISECVRRQQEIIDNIWNALKPGGILIYSTCTFNRHENEDIVKLICQSYGAETIDMNFPDNWNISCGLDPKLHCYRFLPHKTNGEGLFVSVLRKPSDSQVSTIRAPKNKTPINDKIPDTILKTARQWLTNADNYKFSMTGDCVTAFPLKSASILNIITSHLDIIHAGIEIGIVKGKDLIPTQSLALSTALNTSSFPTCEIKYNTAISYLRREAINLENVPRGYILLTYKSHPLGFVKNLGNRANNLYPQEWRILSSYSPDIPPAIL